MPPSATLLGRDASKAGRNRLAQDLPPPAAGAAVVPVAVAVVGEQEDVRRARAERAQRIEELLGEEVVGRAGGAVEEDEEPRPAARARRHDEDLVQVAVHPDGVDGEPLDGASACGVVRMPAAGRQQYDDEHGQGERLAPRRAPQGPR